MSEERDDFDISPAMSYIELQDTLIALTQENINATTENFAKTTFVKDEAMASIFIENVINILTIRPKLQQLLVKMVGELITNPLLNPSKSLLKRTLMHAIFKPIGDWRFVLKIPLFLFLRKFYLERYISLFDITEEIRYMLSNDSKSPNISSIILCVFAGELDRYDSKLFDTLSVNLKNHDHGSFFDIFLASYVKDFEDFRVSDWKQLTEIVSSTGQEAEIHNALRDDDVDTIQRFAAVNGFNPNRPLNDLPFEPCLYLQGGPTMIQYAAFYGSIKCFKFLFLNKASLQLKDRRGRTILHFAIAGGNLEIVRILDQAKLSFKGTLKVAAQFRNFDIFNWIIMTKENESEDFQKTIDQILCMCCRIDNMRGVILSLEHGANPNVRLDGMTPFLNAAMNGHYDILRFLSTSKGVKIDEKNKDGKNALHFAVRSGRIEAVQFLVESGSIDVNAQAGDGGTALHIAAKYGHRNIVEKLMQYPEVDVNAVDRVGATPLHYAAGYAHPEIVKMLLMCNSCDINKKTAIDGKTPLEFARNTKIRAMIAEALSHTVVTI